MIGTISRSRSLQLRGAFLLCIRDYDELIKSCPSGTVTRRLKDKFGERVYLQTWEWFEDKKFHDLSLFVLKRSGDYWESKPLETRMRAYKRDELTSALERAGFKDSEWLMPDKTGFYQPVLAARAP